MLGIADYIQAYSYVGRVMPRLIATVSAKGNDLLVYTARLFVD